MDVLKRVKWPGWVALIVVLVIIFIGLNYIFGAKAEAESRIISDLPTVSATTVQHPKVNASFLKEDKPLDPNGKYVALTFDDGPSLKATPRILDILSRHNIHATFFMLGIQAQSHPDLAKRVFDEGHEVANHSDTHANMKSVSDETLAKEFNGAAKKIEHATSVNPNLFRPPYGAYDARTESIANEQQNSIILWNVDSLDWQTRHTPSIINEVLSTTSNGSIILMHDIYPTTADALEPVILGLQEKGYEFVTVSELLSLTADSGVGPFYSKE